jgi:purine-binding chemotaxis protein CheW
MNALTHAASQPLGEVERGAGAAASEPERQYISFLLDGVEYGVDILHVQEIKGWDAATPVPSTPDYVLGLINLRGTVVPVIDLRLRFGLEKAEDHRGQVVVIVRFEQDERVRVFGLVVDAVSEVYGVSASQVGPPPEFGDSASIDFVEGLVTIEERMLILLDVRRLLEVDAPVR